MDGTPEEADPWPLRHLVLRTPRLELRPDDDDGLYELAALALRGVHPPDRMPFAYAWTDAPPDELSRNLMQHHWKARAEHAPSAWSVTFLVRRDGQVVGIQELTGRDFAVLGEVSSGSWVGQRFQGDGIGTEMRAAVLMFAFDNLGAVRARSGGFTDNTASLAISRKLGYVEDGTQTLAPRGEPVTEQRMLLTQEGFATHRPEWTLEVEGLGGCLPLLGAHTNPGAGTRQ